jgi:hypothetical protein
MAGASVHLCTARTGARMIAKCLTLPRPLLRVNSHRNHGALVHRGLYALLAYLVWKGLVPSLWCFALGCFSSEATSLASLRLLCPWPACRRGVLCFFLCSFLLLPTAHRCVAPRRILTPPCGSRLSPPPDVHFFRASPIFSWASSCCPTTTAATAL